MDSMKRLEALKTEVAKALSKKHRLEGELSQIERQKKELIERADDKLGCTISEVAANLPVWREELEKVVAEIEAKLEAHGLEVEDEG